VPITVTELNVYPIKSCRGVSVREASLDARGLVGDRLMMVVDEDGEFLTQRDLPRLALVAPSWQGMTLELSAAGMPPLAVATSDVGERRSVRVWNDRCTAVDQGNEAAEWLSSFLGVNCRLVRMADEHVRRVDQRYAMRPSSDQVNFADGYPLLIISEGSLADLNSRLPEQVPMNRFRPNIVVAGCAPYAEDGWRSLRVGDVVFDVVKPCARCVLTTVNQTTGRAGKEPLATLATYRTLNGKVMFGQNLIHATTGRIHVGDEVGEL
jgi:uncharacterized protein YcbX